MEPKAVVLEKKVVGHIHQVEGGFQYRPKNTKEKFWGEVYPTFQKCWDVVTGKDEE